MQVVVFMVTDGARPSFGGVVTSDAVGAMARLRWRGRYATGDQHRHRGERRVGKAIV